MKVYRTPEILWQEIDLANVLTESAEKLFVKGEGKDDNTVLNWWK